MALAATLAIECLTPRRRSASRSPRTPALTSWTSFSMVATSTRQHTGGSNDRGRGSELNARARQHAQQAAEKSSYFSAFPVPFQNQPSDGLCSRGSRGHFGLGLPRRGGLQAAADSSVRIRTRLYAAAPIVNIHPTRARPRCRTFRSNATLLIQPKISSIRLRFLWLTTNVPCRVVRASTWLGRLVCGLTCGVTPIARAPV